MGSVGSLSVASDRALLDVAVSGDPSGAVGLLHRYGPGLLAYCRWVLEDADDANEAVVDAIGTLLASPPPPDVSVSGRLHHLAQVDCARRAAARTRFDGDARPAGGDSTDPLAAATESLDHDDATLLFLHLRLGIEGPALAGALDLAPERVPLRLDQLRERCGPEVLAAAARSCLALPGIIASGSPFAHDDALDHVRACTDCEPALASLWRAGMLAPSVPEPTLVAGLEPAVIATAPAAVDLTATPVVEEPERSRRGVLWLVGSLVVFLLLGGIGAALALGGGGSDGSGDLVTSPTSPGSDPPGAGAATTDPPGDGERAGPASTSSTTTGTIGTEVLGEAPVGSAGGGRNGSTSAAHPGATTTGPVGPGGSAPTTPSTGSTTPAPSTSGPSTTGPSTTEPGVTSTLPGGASSSTTTTTTVRTGGPTTTTTAPPPVPVSLAATIIDLDAADPSSAVMLHNDGATSVPWAAGATGAWSVFPGGGTLAPGASTQLTVSIDRSGLPEGVTAAGTLSVTAEGHTVTADLSADVEHPPDLVVAEIPSSLKVKVTTGCQGLVGRVGVDVSDESGIASVVASWAGGSVALNAASALRWQGNLGPFFAEGVHDVTIVATDTRGNTATVIRQVVGEAC